MFTPLKDKKNIFTILWFLLPAIAGFVKWKQNVINNYFIYKGVFTHTLHKTNLYSLYPSEYFDCNHYGPFFSVVIAPFALLPDYIGVPLWVVFNAFVLYKALMVLPIKENYKWLLLLISLVDLMTSSHSVQTNPMVAGMIILSWYYVKKENVIWATFFVLAGTFIKLYGIVGLAFWVFSKQKVKYILFLFLWSAVLFALPMVISSPQFIFQSYFDWYQSIIEKNEVNQITTDITNNRQDISIMGFCKRSLGLTIPSLLFLVPGFLLQILPLVQFKLYSSTVFQLRYVASLLLFVVVFSSSSESPTFIIATTGVAIWFLTQSIPIKKWILFLLTFVIIVTSLTATDLFPIHFRRFFVFYSVKALPCILVWFVCIYQLFNANTNTISSSWINQD
jgi:hypothetical protein